MPFPQAPITTITSAMVQIATDARLDLAFGMPAPFTVRHARNRVTTKGERPCIAFRVTNIEIDPDRQQVHTQAEVCWAATVDIVVDLNLEQVDESGWNALSATANEAANLFLDPASPLLLLVDDTLPGDVDPDEDSTPDDGRLVQSIIVLYRTLRSDLNHLLNSEENAP